MRPYDLDVSPRPSIPRRRERILETAERLVLERGFDAMTMQELASSVGIAKGSIYLEFGSKDNVLEALLAASTQRMLSTAQQQLAGSRAPSLSRGYRALAAALLDEPLLCAAFLDDGGVLGEQVSRVSDGRYRERHRLVAQWIRELQGAGRLRSDVDADSLALALSSATLGLLTAAKTLGPLERQDLLGALEALALMTSSLESEPEPAPQEGEP